MNTTIDQRETARTSEIKTLNNLSDKTEKKPVVFDVDVSNWADLTFAEKVELVARLRKALAVQMNLDQEKEH